VAATAETQSSVPSLQQVVVVVVVQLVKIQTTFTEKVQTAVVVVAVPAAMAVHRHQLVLELRVRVLEALFQNPINTGLAVAAVEQHPRALNLRQTLRLLVKVEVAT
jgi:hypothetical protein